ncbi:unnamed protein product, partial [Ectocarpus fasciculatus]
MQCVHVSVLAKVRKSAKYLMGVFLMFRVYPDTITDSRKLDARVPWDSHGTSNGRPMDVQWTCLDVPADTGGTSQAWTRGTSKRLDAWDVPWDARGTLGTSVGRLGRPRDAWDV